MKYKLLLLDVDGTLVQPKEDALPSKAVDDAVRAAQEKLVVAIATGRPLGYAMPVVNALQLHGFGIFNNGAHVLETTKNSILHEQNLSVRQMREIFRVVSPFGYPVFSDANQYDVPINSNGDIKDPVAKMFLAAIPTDEALKLIAEINGLDDIIAHPTLSWENGDVADVHINHRLATKQHGAEFLAQHLGISKEEIIAIGDGHNDVPLLEAAGLKIAMGNAPEEVKAIADFVTGSLEEDGVAQAIEKFILND